MNKEYGMQRWHGNDMDGQNETRDIMTQVASQIYAEGSIQVFRNTIHAAVTKEAMDNAARLAMLESHYNECAPAGKLEYRRLVESYTDGAIRRMGELK